MEDHQLPGSSQPPFFTVNIRKPKTRAVHGRAAREFLAWCERRGIQGLLHLQPMHVAAYIDQLERPVSEGGGELAEPTVKQHLACIDGRLSCFEARFPLAACELRWSPYPYPLRPRS